jgi:hypothetical protein
MDALTPDVFASPAVGILCDLERDGFRVELAADAALVIAPRSRLTPERMQAIAAHKDALKTLLRCRNAGVQERRDVFARQLAATPAPQVPGFLFLPALPYVNGTCFSCGDALTNARFGRCWRCSLAWRLAAGVPIHVDIAAALDAARVCA